MIAGQPVMAALLSCISRAVPQDELPLALALLS